jgi:ATP-dependent protease ClpP protease subunit
MKTNLVSKGVLLSNDFNYGSQDEMYEESITAKHYHRYIVGEIGHPEEYVSLCQLLRSMSQVDRMTLHINSTGGRLDTTIMLINAIRECAGIVHSFIEYECASAVTLIFLSCSEWSWSQQAKFMTHTASYGSYGKEGEVFAEVTFNRVHLHKMLRDFYTGFLTDTEIQQVIGGLDIYLDADQIAERMDKYSQVSPVIVDHVEDEDQLDE